MKSLTTKVPRHFQIGHVLALREVGSMFNKHNHLLVTRISLDKDDLLMNIHIQYFMDLVDDGYLEYHNVDVDGLLSVMYKRSPLHPFVNWFVWHIDKILYAYFKRNNTHFRLFKFSEKGETLWRNIGSPKITFIERAKERARYRASIMYHYPFRKIKADENKRTDEPETISLAEAQLLARNIHADMQKRRLIAREKEAQRWTFLDEEISNDDNDE